MKKQINVRIESNLIARIDEISTEFKESQAKIVEDILGKFCNQYVKERKEGKRLATEDDFEESPVARQHRRIMNINRT